MTLYDRFERHATESGLNLNGLRIVLGVSGGVDSTVLLELLSHAGADVVGVHINYGLRGDESDLDEQSVRDLFESRNRKLLVKRIPEERVIGVKGKSLQEVAREIRYKEMETVARAEGVQYVAVGHNQDDQAETVLMNLFRGTGLDGLAGMSMARPLAEGITLIRPLLFARREEIIHHATQIGLAWRDDSSNESERFVRSVIRGEILPLVKKHFDDSVCERIAATADVVRGFLSESRQPGLESVIRRLEDGKLLLKEDLVDHLDAAVRKRIVLDIIREVAPDAPQRRSVLDEIDKLRSAQKGKRVDLPGVVVIRERDGLLFVTAPVRTSGASSHAVQLSIGGTTAVDGGLFHAQVLAATPEILDAETPNIVFLDAARCGSGLLVRTWRSGDTMHPLGLRGTKKVSDLLTDAGVRTSTRRQAFVVTSGESVVWLVGHRISADYAVTARTTTVLMICFLPDRLANPSDL